MKPTLALLSILLLLLYSSPLWSQKAMPHLIGDWTFHPNYTLARHAQNYPGHKIEPPKSRFQRFKTLGEPILFYEQQPSERITDFLEPARIPKKAFTIEFWLLNHVNLPVGALMTARSKANPDQPVWLLGHYGNEVLFHVQSENGQAKALTAEIKRGWKKYWGHLVGTYDGQTIKMYLNGQLLASSSEVQGNLPAPDDLQLELAGYFGQEHYMELSNLVKASRLYNHALDSAAINDRFLELKEQVEKGQLFRDTFHFNAGPYLHFATQNSINIVWETDRMASAVIEYGTKLPLNEKRTIQEPAYIQEITLDDLEPETPYFYQIFAISPDGDTMPSGLLTFATAVQEEAAFSFCIIGDTESRPQINHRLGEMIWEERPNFILHLGDVTDGGFEPHKFEWNYEYFTGITPVASRIPVFPVAGNGEADLHWYNRYHRLPEPEAYYTFQYGNAQFFMLNSNKNEELKKGGVQYEWLQEQLASSKATWKIIAHHHCPVSSDENDYGNTWAGEQSNLGDPKFDNLKPLYESAGVDLVFYGHVHAYERSWPLKDGQVDRQNGVVYIQSGGGGGNLEDFVPTHSWFSNKTQRGHHYCKVDIFENTFSFKMYDIEGRLRDFLELEK